MRVAVISGSVPRGKVDYFFNYRGHRCAKIVGAFRPMTLSQAKAKAILDNLELIRAFAEGRFDAQIDQLPETTSSGQVNGLIPD